MTDSEKILLTIKYLFAAESKFRCAVIEKRNFIHRYKKTYAVDALELYAATARYDAFNEISGNIERILFDRLSDPPP